MNPDFLTKLPKSDLDDRRFQDLVEECRLRIPRYCPEWTNHNPSDPGVTLIELFAWLTDQMGLRFNQVPRRNYVAFLELLGITLKPAKPAQTNLTFFLSQPLQAVSETLQYKIPRDTQVATERTETEAAIIFSTDRTLTLTPARICAFYASRTLDLTPTDLVAFPQNWEELPRTLLFGDPHPQPNTGFYLAVELVDTVEPEPVESEARSLQGHLLELKFTGAPATGTGINPSDPPLRWEIWQENSWQPIKPIHDRTGGFNFDNHLEHPLPKIGGLRQASLILEILPADSVDTSPQTCYFRCIYRNDPYKPRYARSPEIVGLEVQTIGGTVPATQAIRVTEEFLGVSDGQAGQSFPLQMYPILDRNLQEEYVEVLNPGARGAQRWTEVSNFGDSSEYALHYRVICDDQEQVVNVQFGPLIREPGHIRNLTWNRSSREPNTTINPSRLDRQANSAIPNDPTSRQYGAVPRAGAEIYMKSYRFGGGAKGNVKAHTLTILRSSLPYISSVTNREAAQGGKEAETLEQAALQVPSRIRTRHCAVTREDFERAALEFPHPKIRIARVHSFSGAQSTRGVVRLLVLPQPEAQDWDWSQGLNPDLHLTLTPTLKQKLTDYLQSRCPLGIHIKLEQPIFVGVKVIVKITLERGYQQPEVELEIKRSLYQLLNPLHRQQQEQPEFSWDFGQPVRRSRIIALCQKNPGVQDVEEVKLLEIHRQNHQWTILQPEKDSIAHPGEMGLICSWEDPAGQFGHEIHF